MKPRITISRNTSGELEVSLNPAGRDLLVNELQRLNEANDHFHLAPEEIGGEVTLQTRAYVPGDEVIDAAKVMLRFDEWDETYFPHVLAGDGR